MANSEYWMRIVVLPRVITGVRDNNEPIETWPDPAGNGGHYSAAPLALNAGEEIRQGVKESTGFLKLKIKGRIAVAAVDHIRVLATGKEYRITAEPIREKRETIIACETI